MSQPTFYGIWRRHIETSRALQRLGVRRFSISRPVCTVTSTRSSAPTNHSHRTRSPRGGSRMLAPLLLLGVLPAAVMGGDVISTNGFSTCSDDSDIQVQKMDIQFNKATNQVVFDVAGTSAKEQNVTASLIVTAYGKQVYQKDFNPCDQSSYVAQLCPGESNGLAPNVDACVDTMRSAGWKLLCGRNARDPVELRVANPRHRIRGTRPGRPGQTRTQGVGYQSDTRLHTVDCRQREDRGRPSRVVHRCWDCRRSTPPVWLVSTGRRCSRWFNVT